MLSRHREIALTRRSAPNYSMARRARQCAGQYRCSLVLLGNAFLLQLALVLVVGHGARIQTALPLFHIENSVAFIALPRLAGLIDLPSRAPSQR